MSKTQILRSLVTERLSAAAEEIFGLFERTIIEYEGEIDRQRKLLHVLKPERRTGSWSPRIPVDEEEVPPELHVKHETGGGGNSQILEPQPPQIKNEGAEEDSVNATVLPVKWEDRQENALPFQPLHTQRQKPVEAEPLPTTSAEPDGEDWDTSEPASYSDAAGSEPVRDGCLLSSDCSGPEMDDNNEELKGNETRQSALRTPKIKETQVTPPAHVYSTTCCRVCGMCCPNAVSLNSHVRVHSSDCGLCGKRLQPTESLTLHLKAHRICTICGEGFTTALDIEAHIRSHTGEKLFSCSDCGKTFKYKSCLKRHMSRHTGQEMYTSVCPVCGKSYSHSGNLKMHMRTHTGEKPFSCSLCGKGFSQNGALKTHMRSHSKERPFSCFVCGKGFTHSGNFKTHLKTHHNERPFRCSVCGKDFSQKISMKKHMRTHLNERLLS